MDGLPRTGPPNWHASTAVLEDYSRCGLDVARAASVEQHLLTCASCRDQLARLVAADGAAARELDELWIDVVDIIDRPRVGVAGRLIAGVGVPDHITRVVLATPALRLSWIVSILLVLAFAVGAALRTGGNDALLLAVAPLIPLAGIGSAYGAGVDPMHELVRAAPLPGSRIFLLRSIAVLVTAVPLTVAASLLVPGGGPAAVAWLLPSIGLVGATLALSTWCSPRTAAATAAAGWLAGLAVVWLRAAGSPTSAILAAFPFRPAGQALFAALGGIGALLFSLRFGRFDAPGGRRVEVR